MITISFYPPPLFFVKYFVKKYAFEGVDGAWCVFLVSEINQITAFAKNINCSTLIKDHN